MGMVAVIYKKGAPDNFVWEETKVGSPECGQVRLRSTAVGVNFADTYHRAGIPHPMIVGDPPVVVGFEGVGKIEELGPGVAGFSVGERVCTCLPPLGAYSQERLYPADKLIKVPKDLPLDDVQLAGLILKGMTAQYLLHRTHKVQPGDYVLIHAAAGGMGHILCPWARHLGATVIGTVSTDAKAEIARNLGCHYVINYSTEDFVAVTRKITDGKGVDVVYESIGKDRCKGHSTACGWSVYAQLTARRQAFPIRSTSSKIWAFAGHFLSPDPCFRITCRTEAKSTPERNPCSMPSHRGW
jgi:NADPH:quinone reductase-like Zn-dependent oxidoreductase